MQWIARSWCFSFLQTTRYNGRRDKEGAWSAGRLSRIAFSAIFHTNIFPMGRGGGGRKRVAVFFKQPLGATECFLFLFWGKKRRRRRRKKRTVEELGTARRPRWRSQIERRTLTVSPHHQSCCTKYSSCARPEKQPNGKAKTFDIFISNYDTWTEIIWLWNELEWMNGKS